MRRAARATVLGAVLIATGCDPVVSNEINALGGEAPGVRRGPLHRPGQPCLLCHDGALGDPPAFSVAGTVFNDPVDLGGADGVIVSLTDNNGIPYMATTNTAGNFYVTPDQWSPAFPLKVIIIGANTERIMQSEIGRDGACASCHVNPAGPSSPGVVCLTTVDGGTPP